ncbi:hypothetical protein IC766_14400 [Acinetobacter seifertii]|uniref:hypothetical protein n=1 Tax=Acinetobacter seifertii TaxID=1530123 RepID=UPI00168BCD4F|nr:hypothetical protein [Acinetobacter seifertii]QNY13290.1 hypothetical protein IC766_14400 [Acinetobacter seifertii]
MDKCREEFEQYIRSQSGFTADFQIGCNGQYKSDLMHFMFVTWQHQQAKVEELKASHHGEVIGHEVHFKKIKQERDELQTLYIQQGINMLKLQKRVDSLEKAEFVLARIKSIASKRLLESILIKEVRQALKGES